MLLENAPFGVIMIDQEGNFKYVNAKFIELFGYELNDIPHGREWFRKAIRSTISTPCGRDMDQ
jgi:PAS domain S-box-containing protein